MTTALERAEGGQAPGRMTQLFWRRELAQYPNTRPRMLYLGIVVLATIMLYYELYVPGAVAPAIISHYNMSFPYYVYIIVVGNVIGAFSSLAAGLADRWGRANLVAYGLVIAALLILFALPNAPNKISFAIAFIALSLAFLQAHGNEVASAAKSTPGQWRNWYWVCVGGEVVFLPLILLMAGRWSPRRARQDVEEHERAMQQELAALQA